MTRLSLLLRAAITWLLLLPLPGLAGAVHVDVTKELAERPSSTREFAFARRHLRQSFDGYGQLDTFTGEFEVVALSHFAAGLMNVFVAEQERRGEVLELLDEVARRAIGPYVVPATFLSGDERFDAKTTLDDHNLYFSHVAVVLGVRRLVACGDGSPCAHAPAAADEALHARLVRHLRARTLESSLFHARSYPDSPRWPADQSVTLLALRLYDEAHGTHLVDEPLAGFLATMKDHTDRSTQLFHSAVTDLTYSKIPRGCALSWTSLYLAQVAPDVARSQYERYREHMSADVLGFGGFREWPADRARGSDLDSGPVILDVGMAATGLGLGPARLFGDADRYATIRRTALTFGLPSWLPSHGHLTAPILGEAILFHGRTARPWFSSARELGPPVSSGGRAFSVTSLVMLLLYVGLLAAWARRTYASISRARGP